MASNTDGTLCWGYLLDEDHPVTWDPEAIYEFVRLVNVCSLQYPIWLVAIDASVITANRGYPKIIDPFSLVLDEAEALWTKILDAFCAEHNIKIEGEPVWYLSSCTEYGLERQVAEHERMFG